MGLLQLLFFPITFIVFYIKWRKFRKLMYKEAKKLMENSGYHFARTYLRSQPQTFFQYLTLAGNKLNG